MNQKLSLSSETDPFHAPLVTVYITNYNYGRFVDQAVQSVLQQFFTDFELIIIDDGSEDNSREVIKKYSGHKKIATVFQKNSGLTVANNIALRMARGRYIMRLDADDFLDENALGILSGVLESNQELDMIYPDYFVVDQNGSVLEIVRHHPEETSVRDFPPHGACTMIRTDRLLELGGYDESIKCQDGFELWLRLKNHYRVTNINLPLFYYRRHHCNLTRDEDRILLTRHEILKNHAAEMLPLNAVAIIPVRGSKIHPGSMALRMLGNKPLIAWTIDEALKSKKISDVCVTTPDTDIIRYVQKTYQERVRIVKRNMETAMFNTPIEETLFLCLDRIREEIFDLSAIAILYVESPFRNAHHIDAALNAMCIFNTDIVVGIRPETDQIYQRNRNGLAPMRKNQVLRLEREDFFKEAGQIRIVRLSFMEKNRKITDGKTGHIVLDQEASLRLRTELDWKIAEFLAKERFR